MSERERALRLLAVAAGVTSLRALARVAGVDKGTIRALLAGRAPRRRTLAALSRALGVEIDTVRVALLSGRPAA